MKFIEKVGICGYHLGEPIKVRLCRVRRSVKDGWQYPMFICENCRNNLRRQFKYVKENEERLPTLRKKIKEIKAKNRRPK